MNAIRRLIEPGVAAFDAALIESLADVSADDLVAITRTCQAIIQRATALSLAATAVGAKRDAHKVAGAGSMTSLIAQTTGVSRRAAARDLELAEHLAESPSLAQTMTRPGMSTAKAHLIAHTMDELPAGLTAEQHETIEEDLATVAPGMSIEQLRRKARRALEVIDPKRADRLENEQLVREEAVQRSRLSFWMSRPDECGMVKGGFEIDALTADMLRAVLESKTSPRHRSLEHNAADHREHAGEAFSDILRHLPKDGYGNHGGVAATLMVTVGEATLRGECDRAGVTETGVAVSAGQLRHIACNAGILPAVIGGESEVLDLGREKRLHSPAQRRALAHRDQGCAFPGCDRPPGWCESHHITSWSDGGGTSLENGVLLCGFHHRTIHTTTWRVEVNPRDKLPDFYEPGTDRAIRNTRYRPAK